MDVSHAIGIIGSSLLITCSLPQLIKTLKIKNVEGLSLYTCLMCCIGCFMVLYYIAHGTKDGLLIFNYFFNGSVYLILTLLWFKYRKK
jgi:uncharacterized protein with PQ loop repeat